MSTNQNYFFISKVFLIAEKNTRIHNFLKNTPQWNIKYYKSFCYKNITTKLTHCMRSLAVANIPAVKLTNSCSLPKYSCQNIR